MRSPCDVVRRLALCAITGAALGCGTSIQQPLDASEQALSGFTGPGQLDSSDAQLVPLGDGRILAVVQGGAEIYSPATNAWTVTPAMTSFHAHAIATRLNDGRVLAFGGWDTAGTKMEVYDPATNAWTTLPDMTIPRASSPVVTLGDGRVLVTVAYASGAGSISGGLWNPATQSWTPTSGAPTKYCYQGRALLLNDGRAFFLCNAGAETYSPATGTFTALPPLAHQYDVAVKLSDGRVLLAGGNSASTQIFDPVTNQLSSSAPMAAPVRYFATAALLGDGTVVVAGGTDGTNTLPTVERWTPSTGTWSAAPSLLQKREGATMVALGSGDGLIASGVYRLSSTSTSNVPLAGWAERIPSLGSCPPATCATLGASCGSVPDGCGGTLQCGSCAMGETCSANACHYFATRGTYSAPACSSPTAICDSGSTLNGRAGLGPEPGAPNTLAGSPCADGTAGTYHVDESIDQIVLTSVGGGPITAGRQVQVSVRVWTYSASADRLDLFITSAASFPTWSFLTTLSPTTAGASTLSTTFTVPPSTTLGAIRANFRYNGGAASCTFGSYDDHDDLVYAAAPPVPDTVPPTATITAPAAGATVSGNVSLVATASDDLGVTRVEFYDGSTFIGSSAGPTWTVTWASASVANGTHDLAAKAYDVAGNVGTSPVVSVTVNNDKTPPTTALTAPAAGTVLSGTATLVATATDNVSVARVDFYDGATNIGSAYNAPYSFAWNTTAVANGSHTLTSRAFDWAGNSGTSPAVVVTVSNTTPVVSVASYDASRRAPTCATATSGCDSGSLLTGRGTLGPEPNQPNTLNSACSDGLSGAFHSDESLDRLVVRTLDGTSLTAGKTVSVDATVWAWSTGASDALDLYYAPNASSPTWTFLGTIVPTKGGAQTLSKTFTLQSGSVQVVRGVFRYGGTAASCGVGGYTDNDDLVFSVQ